MAKRNVAYIQQNEPSFIKQFKARVGYKEGPTLDTKRAKMPEDDDSDDDRPELEDEKPTVVVLKSGDLTAEEAEKLGISTSPSEDTPLMSRYAGPSPKDGADSPPEGRVLFKKPVKKAQDSSNNTLSVSSSSASKKQDSKQKTGQKEPEKQGKSKTKKLSNTKLLSFNDEEEEEED